MKDQTSNISELDELAKNVKSINLLSFNPKEHIDIFYQRFFSLLRKVFNADSAFVYLNAEILQGQSSVEYVIDSDSNVLRLMGNTELLGISIHGNNLKKEFILYHPDVWVSIEKIAFKKQGLVIKPIVIHAQYVGGFGLIGCQSIPSPNNEVIMMHFLNALVSALREFQHLEYVKRLQHISDIYKVALDKSSFILFTDRKGLLTYANDAFLKILNLDPKDMFGAKVENLVFSQDQNLAIKDILTLVLNGQIWTGELCLSSLGGKDFWLMGTIIPHKGNDGKITQVVFVCYDITAQKNARDEMVKAKKMAEEAMSAKSFFLSNMSHEIRTPLNAIVGIVDIFGEDSLSVEQRRNLSILRNASQNLLSIVNDVLDFSKIESKMLDIVQTEFILRESIEEPCLLHSQNASKNKVQIYCRIEKDCDLIVSGDRTRIEQVISNLISNAIKFTHNGSVVLSVNKYAGNRKGNFIFEVRDSGEGMDEKEIGRLFKPFSQLSTDVARKAKGTGLGLAICRKLVELMGGEIWIESNKNIGTSVFFTLNFSKTRHLEDTKVAANRIDANNETLVFLCDNSLLLDIIFSFLPVNETKKLVFKNFISLIEWLDFQMDSEKVVLVLDVAYMKDVPVDMMKDVISKYNQLVKTIVLNTFSSKEVEYSCKEAGFVHLYSSPLLKNEFNSALNGLSAKINFSNTSYDVEDDLNLKILLVDDVEDNRTLIKAYLKKYNCEISEADSGIKAIDLFKKDQYDVILMDIQMPEMDGVTATKQIRAYEMDLGLTPVIIVALTAFAQEEERNLFLQSGCNFHLSKPIKKTVLIKSLEGILKNKKVSHRE